MILFAAGMVTGAFITLAVALLLTAKNSEFKSETHYKGNR